MKRLVSTLAGLLLIVTSCGDGSTDQTSTLATTSTTASASTSSITVGETTTTEVAGLLIEIAVHTDEVVLIVDSLEVELGVRVAVASGTLIRIVTAGEVAEEVHVHGYDVTLEVTPGEEETVEFIADIPGIFEVELEDAGTLILELEVS